MCTKLSATYTNLVMVFLEVYKNEQTKLKYGLNFDSDKLYLDDCLIRWMHTLDQINEFNILMNIIKNSI